MSRKVLLIEPYHKNKYPPMGLMKLATYHKMLGDEVTFFKGELKELVLDCFMSALFEQLEANEPEILWRRHQSKIRDYIKRGRLSTLHEISTIASNPIIALLFKHYRQSFYRKEYFSPQNRKWDRICITTLFTFYWDISVETINFVKQLCRDESEVWVGGIIATILSKKLEEATGLEPFVGLLDRAGILDENDIIIDDLPLDYSIIHEIDYEYTAADAYLAYATRGCVNKCKFCAVPILEPKYKEYIPIDEHIEPAAQRFGPKKDLLLLDNNVLASKRFDEIIDSIKKIGFEKDARLPSPNYFEIAVSNLRDGHNDVGYLRNVVKQYHTLFRRFGVDRVQQIYDLLDSYCLLDIHTAKKEAVFATYNEVKGLFEKLYKKPQRRRYVDFNQGLDARLVTEENMKKLAEISIRPLRIAFDNWAFRDVYERAVRIAAKYGHRDLSNYLLYNYDDLPVELYKRIRLNIDLCNELDIRIYSFPMKYHPIDDPDYFNNRHYLGKHWNRKYIRTIQAILNATKGKVGRGYSFFCEAFGSNEREFEKLLYMPETMIIYRNRFKEAGVTEEWWNSFNDLSKAQREVIEPIIFSNDFTNIDKYRYDEPVKKVLSFYTIKANDIKGQESDSN